MLVLHLTNDGDCDCDKDKDDNDDDNDDDDYFTLFYFIYIKHMIVAVVVDVVLFETLESLRRLSVFSPTKPSGISPSPIREYHGEWYPRITADAEAPSFTAKTYWLMEKWFASPWPD
ncbi:hypothetical protein EVAR_72591_1 [Eumeta japonica]|uniref:Uncharacterized protein n=1 Tax=Eumeta variegata TaxID=151549 RepID=A0A4C1SIU7_EUMVA|nr:hypothetical protein EVAR_72591_1 [Eumeta japonica]